MRRTQNTIFNVRNPRLAHMRKTRMTRATPRRITPSSRLTNAEMTMFQITANTNHEASAATALIRKPEQVLAVFRRDGADGPTFWVAELDAAKVDALAEAQKPGPVDDVEAYAATFAEPGDVLISVH
jgi:hypothetical protein